MAGSWIRFTRPDGAAVLLCAVLAVAGCKRPSGEDATATARPVDAADASLPPLPRGVSFLSDA